jgi:glutathione peroxidase
MILLITLLLWQVWTQPQQPTGFYDLHAKTIDGETFDFAALKGKRVLIVNTASECGYTPQYEGLQALYEQFGGARFTIIAFPSNDFGGQEPGTSEEIITFCKQQFGVSFPVMEKVAIKGREAYPVYLWLTQKKLNGVSDAEVGWNFNKFLIDEHGRWTAHFSSKIEPQDSQIVKFASWH